MLVEQLEWAIEQVANWEKANILYETTQERSHNFYSTMKLLTHGKPSIWQVILHHKDKQDKKYIRKVTTFKGIDFRNEFRGHKYFWFSRGFIFKEILKQLSKIAQKIEKTAKMHEFD